MSDPRADLATLITAFERHLEVCSTRRGEEDPSVVAAYEDLADAFEEYDASLYDAYGEMTPLDIYGADDEDLDSPGSPTEQDELEDDSDPGDARYAGLDGDVDFDDDEDDDEEDDDDDE